MSESKRVGQWAALFGGRRSFAAEIRQAVEIGADWRADDCQRDIVLDEIPGWLDPMWGTDKDWLYIRRPQGIWKTRLPKTFDGETPLSLCQIRTRPDGQADVVGAMSLGRSLFGHPGWIRGSQVGSPLDAADRDDAVCPAVRGVDVDADAVGRNWGKTLKDEGGRILVDGGGYFDQPPAFERGGDWLFATDRSTGWRVAFPLAGKRAYIAALEAGNLWLRLGSRWSNTMEVKVVLRS